MKAKLVPVYFDPGRDEDFDIQLARLNELLADVAEFLPPAPLGGTLPATADAVIFPQFLGEAYRHLADFQAIDRPIFVVTSEFGTLNMWDWEIVAYLESEGVTAIAPYTLEQTKMLCRAAAARSELRGSKFLVFQDNPGEGFQPAIFKRFYWWEDEAAQRLFDKFGITIVKKSFREFGTRAKAIPNEAAAAEWENWQWPVALSGQPLLSAVKVYLALKDELAADPAITSMGINCLNESRFSDTTPCLAWMMLYEEGGLMWGCEADTLSMATKYLLHKSLGVPIMMTNLYPSLMSGPALKHERIPHFPDVSGYADKSPDNYLLAAHCGYFGLLPPSFGTEWTMRSKVLAIVDDNAHAIDARFPTGPVTLAKLHPTMQRLTAVEGTLEGYAQFPGSDCLNGGVIHVPDGHQLVRQATSHHYLVTTGHNLNDMRLVLKVFGLGLTELGGG
ncbi:MAG: hypothetical protein H3C69_08190 [Candidatus Promineofilum sp.]|nr:hypothetical protein [Promineifilum sp.]